MMRRYFRFSMLFAAAATAFLSCTEDRTETPNPQIPAEKVTIRFSGSCGDETDAEPRAERSAPGTRTELGDSYRIKWLADDILGIYIGGTGAATTNAEAYADRNAETGAVTFLSEVNPFEAGDVLHAYYPHAGTNSAEAGTASLSIPSVQAQTAAGDRQFNGSYNPLVSVPFAFPAASSETLHQFNLQFRQTAAMVEFGICSANAAYRQEAIRSVRFINAGGEPIAGTFPYDLTSVTATGAMPAIDRTMLTEGSRSVTVSLPSGSEGIVAEAPGTNLLYLSLIPGTYTGDVVVTTDKAVYTYAGKSVDFKRAYMKRITLDLANAARSERVGGSYIWNLASGDLGTSAAPLAVVSKGTPALAWRASYEGATFFAADQDRGMSIGSSGSVTASAQFETDNYGDDIESVIVNAAVASNGSMNLSVYLDGALLATQAIDATTSADYTFAPPAAVKAGNIRIVMENGAQKAMYLKSIKIVSANQIAQSLAAPAIEHDAANKQIVWTGVPGAAGYEYTLDGQSVAGACTSPLDYSAWPLGSYTVRVRATGDGINYEAASAWSEPVTVTIEAPTSGQRYVKVTAAPIDGDWSGTYLIAYSSASNVYALSGESGSDRYGAYADISNTRQDDGSLLLDDTAYDCVVEQSANGYTIRMGNTYLGYTGSPTATSGSNNLDFEPTVTAMQFEWTLASANGVSTVTNANATHRPIKWNGTSRRFACYYTGQSDITLYQKEDKTPRIVLAQEYKSLKFTATTRSGTFPFLPKNLTDGVTAAVTAAAGEWFAAVVDNSTNTVSWTATENTEPTPRTATLTLSAAGAEPVVVSVEQSEAPRPLTAPANLVVTADGLMVTASWNAVTDASGYAWRIVAREQPSVDVKRGTTGETAVDITGLDAGTTYLFYVKALGNGTTRLDSEEVSGEATTASSLSPIAMPAVAIDAAKSTASSLTVSWPTPVDGAAGFSWKAVPTDTAKQTVSGSTDDGTITSIVVTGLESASEYTVTVTARANEITHTGSASASASPASTTEPQPLVRVDESFPTGSSSSYGSGTTTSATGTSWSFTNARTDQKIGTAGSITFKANTSATLSTTVDAQVKTISFTVAMPFSDSSVSVELYINDTKVGTYTANSKTGTEYTDIDVSSYSTAATTVIKFKNGTAKRASIGKISYQK